MQIQVCINEEGALHNQRYAFSNKYTLVTELLQNARRAGAHQIHVQYDEVTQVLRVEDDGHGIADFQKLLTFNESGWDQATAAEERPFGIGFSKCLYASIRCIVCSLGQSIDFLTADALKRQPIEVNQIEETPVTSIELHGVQLPQLRQQLESLCIGFPVAVWLNGEVLDQPFANNASSVATSIGNVYLAGASNGKYSTCTLIFLQGFCVSRPIHYLEKHVNVVHLDSRSFTARLPDRDQLIDAADQIKRVDQCLKSLWRTVLIEAKAKLSAEAFVEQFYEAMRAWGHLDLLTDIPVLPRAICSRISGYPIQAGYEPSDYLEAEPKFITKTDVENNSVRLVDLDYMNDETAACWMLARALEWVVITAGFLPDDHWVHAHIIQLDPNALHITIQNEHCRYPLEGRWISSEVVLCEAIELRLNGYKAHIYSDGIFHDNRLLIPDGELSGESIRQASSYIDHNDTFHEDDLEHDKDLLADVIRRLRFIDPLATLNSLLQELNLEKYPLLQGCCFQMHIGHTAQEHILEQIPMLS